MQKKDWFIVHHRADPGFPLALLRDRTHAEAHEKMRELWFAMNDTIGSELNWDCAMVLGLFEVPEGWNGDWATVGARYGEGHHTTCSYVTDEC